MNRAVRFHPAPVDEGLTALTTLCRAALSERVVQADDEALKAAMESLVTLLEACNALRRRRRRMHEAVAFPFEGGMVEPVATQPGSNGRPEATAS